MTQGSLFEIVNKRPFLLQNMNIWVVYQHGEMRGDCIKSDDLATF